MMKNTILKSNIISIIAVVLGATLLFAGSCKKQDEMHRKYIENGEILYLGKTDSLLAYPGYQRAKVLWIPPVDPKVEHIKLFWNQYADSLVVPIERLEEGVFQEVIINGLTEGMQTFILYSINEGGNTSVKSELNVPVYGDDYIETLQNRFPLVSSYDGEELDLIFATAESSVVMTELAYTDLSGNPQTIIVDHETNNVTISNFDSQEPITYRTKHSPHDNAIDEFFTPFEELEIPYQLGRFPVFITGIMRDPINTTNDINYEYIQFMAAIDIDFSETPLSVVVCRNPNNWAPNPNDAPENGWAIGGRRSYKFDLTEGTVSKGEFFYVGGTSKVINGPNSTPIGDDVVNWIRTKNYGTEPGDGGIGDADAVSGLLPNFGNPAGIAIFNGLEVTETSVPIDAIFFGNSTVNNLQKLFADKGENGLRGYRIPDSDLYQTTAADGTPQPFFAQGTGAVANRANGYIVPPLATADQENGNFIKLGGVFDARTRTWETSREWSYIFLEIDSQLSDIESSTGVTTMVN